MRLEVGEAVPLNGMVKWLLSIKLVLFIVYKCTNIFWNFKLLADPGWGNQELKSLSNLIRSLHHINISV